MNLRHRTTLAVAAIAAAGAVTVGAGQAAHADGNRGNTPVRIAVIDQDGAPLRPSTVMACPVVAGSPDCDAAELAATNRRGVARLRLDRDQRYEFSAFVQDPDPPWACPGFELDGSEYYFSADRFTATPRNVPRAGDADDRAAGPVRLRRGDGHRRDRCPVADGGHVRLPVAPDGTPCPGPSFDGPDPDGVIRLHLDPAVTYRLQAFIVNTGWPCPAFVAPNGDTFHFSASVDLPATQVSGSVFVIDRPDPPTAHDHTTHLSWRPGVLLVVLAAVAACASGDDEPADVAPVSPPTSPAPSSTTPAATATTTPSPPTTDHHRRRWPVHLLMSLWRHGFLTLVGYRTAAPGANSVLWPQFDLPDDVTVHAVNVEGDDDAAGSLVVVDGLDFDQHVNTLFDDEVELIIDAEAVPGDNMVLLTKPVQATWRNLGTAVIEAVRPDHDYGQWVWTHDDLTWVATGNLAMEAYTRSLIEDQQRVLPSEPWDYGALGGDIWDRLVVVPGYTYVDAPVLHALDGLPVTPFANCAKRFYVGFPREVDMVDVAPVGRGSPTHRGRRRWPVS